MLSYKVILELWDGLIDGNSIKWYFHLCSVSSSWLHQYSLLSLLDTRVACKRARKALDISGAFRFLYTIYFIS